MNPLRKVQRIPRKRLFPQPVRKSSKKLKAERGTSQTQAYSLIMLQGQSVSSSFTAPSIQQKPSFVSFKHSRLPSEAKPQNLLRISTNPSNSQSPKASFLNNFVQFSFKNLKEEKMESSFNKNKGTRKRKGLKVLTKKETSFHSKNHEYREKSTISSKKSTIRSPLVKISSFGKEKELARSLVVETEKGNSVKQAETFFKAQNGLSSFFASPKSKKAKLQRNQTEAFQRKVNFGNDYENLLERRKTEQKRIHFLKKNSIGFGLFD